VSAPVNKILTTIIFSATLAVVAKTKHYSQRGSVPALAFLVGIVVVLAITLPLILNKKTNLFSKAGTTLFMTENVVASEDTYVDSDLPDQNFGSAKAVTVSMRPVRNGYFKFNLQPLAGKTLTAAKLKLTLANNTNGDQIVNLVTNDWSEGSLNYASQPQVISSFAVTNARKTEEVITLDVTTDVLPNIGNYISFMIRTTANNGPAFYSKEADFAVKRPVLEITELTATSTPTQTPTPTPASTSTPTPTPTPTITGNVKVLCDGKSFSNWGNKAAIEIGNNADDTNPNIMKVIRNCNFVNPTGTGVDKPAILIQAGNNILIENSRFDNIRTLQANNGVHGIGITGSGLASNITIRGSYFNDIGADGIQTAYSGTKVQDIRIENNEFIGSEAVGENAIDIKSGGPYVISGNRIHGFRPCQSAKTNPPGNQDCSGSTGPAIVIHIGSVNVAPSGIVIDGNNIYDNTYGINVSGGNNILIKNNYIHNNIKAGITHSGGTVTLQNNTYSGNGTNCSGISPCQ